VKAQLRGTIRRSIFVTKPISVYSMDVGRGAGGSKGLPECKI